MIFTSKQDFDDWIPHVTSEQTDTVDTILKQSFYTRTEPYVYRDQDDKYYLIQNVKGSSLGSAMYIANHWYLYNQNLGYMIQHSRSHLTGDEIINNIKSIDHEITSMKEPYPDNVIYKVTESGLLRAYIDNTSLQRDETYDDFDNSNPFLMILSYDDKRHAAILPIL